MDGKIEAACASLDEFTSAVERTFSGVTNPLFAANWVVGARTYTTRPCCCTSAPGPTN